MTEVLCPSTQAESSLSRLASDSRGAETRPSSLTQGVVSTSAGQSTAESCQAEQVGVKQTILGIQTAHDLPPASPPPLLAIFRQSTSLDMSFPPGHYSCVYSICFENFHSSQ